MKLVTSLKRKLGVLGDTPLHPQWLMRENTFRGRSLIAAVGENQTVLDIGCFNKWPKRHLPSSCEYLGLDYYETAVNWYGSVPDIYGDALSLPLAPESIDVVLLLDVLEHISDTQRLLEQIHRVLKPGGSLLITVPFLYPLHDEPRDFVRLTAHGIRNLAECSDYDVTSLSAVGTPVTTATLLLNLAIAKAAINWISEKSLLSILAVVTLPLIPVTNLAAKLVSYLEVKDAFMPNSYQAVLRKRG